MHRQGSPLGKLLTARKISPALHGGINHAAAASVLGTGSLPSLGVGATLPKACPVPFRAAHWPGPYQRAHGPVGAALLTGPVSFLLGGKAEIVLTVTAITLGPGSCVLCAEQAHSTKYRYMQTVELDSHPSS